MTKAQQQRDENAARAGSFHPVASASVADVEALQDLFDEHLALTQRTTKMLDKGIDRIEALEKEMDEMAGDLNAFRASTNGKSGPIGRIEKLEKDTAYLDKCTADNYTRIEKLERRFKVQETMDEIRGKRIDVLEAEVKELRTHKHYHGGNLTNPPLYERR